MLKYAGQKLKEKVSIQRAPEVAKAKGWPETELIHPYIADPDLIKAVNLSILLQRPLLLMGEPGCGKTRVAQAVAYELYHQINGGDIQRDYRSFYHEWNIKSSSKAQEGLYSFDAIRRLGDAQILSAQAKVDDKIDLKKELDKQKYIEYGEMGKAFRKSNDEQLRPILLIDEIDKADIDFPNDLLNELDNAFFRIPETGERISARVKPIVFITSNAEKDLPDAFLRRCLFHYIKPFDEQMFIKIVNSRFYQLDQTEPAEELVEKAVQQFIAIRDKINEQKSVTGKSISTSELIDWFEALKYYHQIAAVDASESTKLLLSELEKAGKGTLEIPFRQVLLKNWNTLAAFDEFKK
jgi:MoxR-like ATPase